MFTLFRNFVLFILYGTEQLRLRFVRRRNPWGLRKLLKISTPRERCGTALRATFVSPMQPGTAYSKVKNQIYIAHCEYFAHLRSFEGV